MKNICSALLLTSAFTCASAQDGLLDPSFSTDGKIVFDQDGHEDDGTDVVVRPDGKIWVLGNSYDEGADTQYILLMRYNADGTLDNTFYTDGIEEISAGDGYSHGDCLVLQPDGKLLIGGYYIPGTVDSHPLVFRVDENGNFDPSFGAGGMALDMDLVYRIKDMGVQSDGTIVCIDGVPASIIPAVQKITSTGVFAGFTQYFICNNHNDLNGMAITADNKVLMTGNHGLDTAGTNYEAFVMRLNADLSGDIDFSPGYECGELLIQTSGIEYYTTGNPSVFTYDVGNDIAETPEGDYIIAGASMDTANNADVLRSTLWKVHPNSELDAGFGNNGYIRSFTGSHIRRIAIQSDGKVLATGQTYGSFSDYPHTFLARYGTDGSLDTDFGTNGSTEVHLGFTDAPRGMAVQPDGRVLVVGSVTGGPDYDIGITRYSNGPAGVEEHRPTASALRLYPDPSAGSFTVELPVDAQEIFLLNALGQVVAASAIGNAQLLKMEVGTPGSYSVVVKTASGRVARKLIVM